MQVRGQVLQVRGAGLASKGAGFASKGAGFASKGAGSLTMVLCPRFPGQILRFMQQSLHSHLEDVMKRHTSESDEMERGKRCGEFIHALVSCVE